MSLLNFLFSSSIDAILRFVPRVEDCDAVDIELEGSVVENSDVDVVDFEVEGSVEDGDVGVIDFEFEDSAENGEVGGAGTAHGVRA